MVIRSLKNINQTRHLLAKHKAAVTPMKPKKGAEVGQVSRETVVLIFINYTTGLKYNK